MSAELLRALKAERKFVEAIVRYRHLIITGQADAEVHLLGGQVATATGDFPTARDALEAALDLGPEGSVLGMARFVLATVLLDMGEFYSAIEGFTRWLDEQDRYPELLPSLYGAALYNRALAYRCAKRYADSLPDYVGACEAFRLEGAREYLIKGLQNLAWVACLCEDAVEAQAALDEARALCASPDECWNQRIGDAFLEAIRGSRATATHRQHRAMELCLDIAKYSSDDGPSPAVRSHAYWLCGKLSLRLRQDADAEGYAHQALHHGALANQESRCLYDAGDLLREVYRVRLLRHAMRTKGLPREEGAGHAPQEAEPSTE